MVWGLGWVRIRQRLFKAGLVGIESGLVLGGFPTRMRTSLIWNFMGVKLSLGFCPDRYEVWVGLGSV